MIKANSLKCHSERSEAHRTWCWRKCLSVHIYRGKYTLCLNLMSFRAQRGISTLTNKFICHRRKTSRNT